MVYFLLLTTYNRKAPPQRRGLHVFGNEEELLKYKLNATKSYLVYNVKTTEKQEPHFAVEVFFLAPLF